VRQAFNEEMTAGKVDWQLHLYGGVVHSFTNKEADTAASPMSCVIARMPTGAPSKLW
jgi:dienelactone hydrolase